MWAAILSAAEWLLGLILPKKVDPSTTQLADSNAHAVDKAAQETANAEVLNTALEARTAADAGVVRSDPAANEVHSDPSAPVNSLPGEHWRD